MPKPPIPRRAGGKACNSKLLVLWDRERTCWALQSDSETMASLSNLAMFVGVLIVLLSCIVTADTSGWDLREYEHCKKVDTTGVAGAVNDVTYSPITNSLWMLALGSSVELVEYSMEGYRLRDMGVVDGGLHKPQGKRLDFYVECCTLFETTSIRTYCPCSMVGESNACDRVCLMRPLRAAPALDRDSI